MKARKVIQWKNRQALIKRGVRMILAHWRNRVFELDDLNRWYERNHFKYAAFNHYPNMPRSEVIEQLNAIRAKFWHDCIRIAHIEIYGKVEYDFEMTEQRRNNRRQS